MSRLTRPSAILLVAGAVLASWTAWAAPAPAVGHVDLSFHRIGHVAIRFWDGPSSAGVATAVRTQQNGKIVLAGKTWNVRVSEHQPPGPLSVVRLSPDGQPDLTFGAGTGRVRFDIERLSKASVSGLTLYADGRILVAGSIYSRGAFLARLLPDGRLDATFGVGGIVDDQAGTFEDVATAGGKILAAGAGGLARFNGNGSPDATFGDRRGGRGRVATQIYGETKLRVVGNQILVAGHADGSYGPLTIGRWNSDGSPDTSFGTSGRTELPGRWGSGLGLQVTDQGAVVVVGTLLSGGQRAIGLLRLSSSGRPDAGLNGGQPFAWSAHRGVTTNIDAVAASRHRDGIVVVGETGSWNDQQAELFLAKFDGSGRLVGEFDLPQASARMFYGRGVATQHDEKVVVVGQTRDFRRGNTLQGRLWPHFAALRFSDALSDPPPPAVPGGKRPER